MPDVTVFMTFFVPQAALHRHLSEHRAHRLAQRLRSVEHEQHPLLGIQAALDQVRQQRGRDRRVLRRSFPQPERDLHPLGPDPEPDDHHPALELEPVEHHHRQAQIAQLAAHQLAERLAGALHERPGHRRLRRRPCPGLDRLADWLLYAAISAGRHAGEHPLQHAPAKRITVGEMLVGLQRHLGLPVRSPRPRSAPPPHDGRRASPLRRRDRDAPRPGRSCACPSDRRRHRPPPPSIRSERRAQPPR